MANLLFFEQVGYNMGHAKKNAEPKMKNGSWSSLI